MNKYIIKSCEQIHSADNFCWSKNILCQDCTDCVMKQIVELCRKQKVINCNIDEKEQVLKAYYHTHLGDKILELLDIEEVE